MYTLHVVASERRLSQVSLVNTAGTDGGQRAVASRSHGTLGDSDSFSDDSEGELLGRDLDDNSQFIEFTAGNPRVEHITGVVHLYRPTPGHLPQTTPAAAITPASALARPVAPQQRHKGSSPAGSPLPALISAPPPTKSHASWASLLGAPTPTLTHSSTADTAIGPPPPPSQASVGGGCDELCCLALPSDMTIADFCTFLGAHLLRLRRMRVLRRQVGPATHVASALAAATTSASAPAIAPAGPLPLRSSAGASTSRSGSGGGGGNGDGDLPGPRRQSQEGQQAAQPPMGDQVSEPAPQTPRRGEADGPTPLAAAAAAVPRQAPEAAGVVAGGDPGALRPTRGSLSDLATPGARLGHTLSSNHMPSETHPQPQFQPQQKQQQQQQQEQLAVSGAPPRPPLHVPRPPSQRVVCMVLMLMESSEAADELYTDLNGKPFSSLEPDIVCRLVHVRHVEVTSGGGRHGTAAATVATDVCGGGGGAPDVGATTAAALAATLAPPPPPPPGQTELPTCPVCLERLDEHVSGIVTTVCNHMFHSECLQKWADTTCPVCRYCVQGAANTSRCGVCATAVDLWICLICGHVGCGRYRAGHAADHWRTSGHCYALELETQRVWDYVGDNYVHRLIQSKTDGKLVELAAPATAVASPHTASRAGGLGGGGGRVDRNPHHHRHDADHASCGAAGGGRDGGGLGGGGEFGSGRAFFTGGAASGGGAAGGSGSHDGGGPGWSTADEQLKEALMASKLDAIAVEYNHLLASQLDSQRQYYEGLVAQAALDADHRCAQAGAAADKARTEADEALAAVREETRRRHAAERRAADTAEELRNVRQEAEFLRSLNETLLANQRDFKQQVAMEKTRADAAGATIKELQEQVRDLAFFIEAQRTINDAADGELREGTLLPLPQSNSSRAGRAAVSGTSGRAGSRAGGGGSGSRGGGSGK